MEKDPRENFRKDHGVSFVKWFWTCIKICILIIMIPLVLGSLVFLASVCLPVLFIAVPIMVAAWIWVLLT